MKLALLLPGYIESPDYHHLVVIDQHLTRNGYQVIRVDACHLWETGDGHSYSTTDYINQVKEIVRSYLPQNPTEILLVGHSLGCLVSLVVGQEVPGVSKIVCLCPPSSLDKSDHKWVDGFRVSQKDLPGDSQKFRQFSVPFSFTNDRKQYSIIDSLKSNQLPLQIIMGTLDPSTSELSPIIKVLNKVNFQVIEAMGHDFRQSEDLCQSVAIKIVDFISD